MAVVGTLVTWSPGDVIPSTGMNSNFADLKASINTALFTDTAGTVTVQHTYSAPNPFAFSHADWTDGALAYTSSDNLTALALGAANAVLTSNGTVPGWTAGLLNAHIRAEAAIVASKIAGGTFGAGTYSFAGSTIDGTPTWGSSQAITLSAAAQPNITSLGTLTALRVDHVRINGNTINATAGALHLKPAAGYAIVLDGTINVDAGVVTGATSITSTKFVGNVTGNVTGSSGSTTGNAATATALANARTINGVSFNGTANITVRAAAGTLTGATLKSTVVTSSLTSLGTIAVFEGGSGHFTGRVGIGVVPTSYALHVKSARSGAEGLGVEMTHATNPRGVRIYYSGGAPDSNTQNFLTCTDTISNRTTIRSDGDVWTSDSGVLSSDESIKENIVDATSKLADVLALRVINFNWSTEFHPAGATQLKKRIGLGASDVEAIFPTLVELVTQRSAVRDAQGEIIRPAVMKKAVRQGAIGPPILIKAFQEYVAQTNGRIATLEAEITALSP